MNTPTETTPSSSKFVFPRWANYLLPLVLLGGLGAGMYVPVLVGLGLNPNTLNKNYRPKQPVPYSHSLHVGQLGLDCTYCHTTVTETGFAAIPPVETCIACHNPEKEGSGVKKDSPKLAALHAAYRSGKPVKWVKVHDLADYAYFNHSAHVTKGVGCSTCHGRVDRMGEEGVHQHANLSMGWCIDCHRAPEKNLRPPSEVTNMAYTPLDDPEVIAANITNLKEAQLLVGRRVKAEYNVHNAAYMQSCSTCHR
ncbi:MAG: cytochrome c3 family protein [Algisphaera sp.]